MSKPCPTKGVAIYLDCLECDTKECKKSKYNRVIVGIDQSYNNTGISIAADGKLKKVKSLRLEGLENNSEKRRALASTLDGLLRSVAPRTDEVVCIIERIRLRSQGFLNIDYIKSIGALNSVIVDTCHDHSVTVYSVDTRCWKSQVIGTSKPSQVPNKYGVPDEKWPTVKWLLNQGWENSLIVPVSPRKKKGTFERDGQRFMYNNDAADSAGIAMFGFLGDQDKLQLER